MLEGYVRMDKSVIEVLSEKIIDESVRYFFIRKSVKPKKNDNCLFCARNGIWKIKRLYVRFFADD